MKTNKFTFFRLLWTLFTRKNVLVFSFVLLGLILNFSYGQTTMFFDDFNRGAVVKPLNNGGTPTMTYTTVTTSTGQDIGISGAYSTTKLITGSDYTANISPANSTATLSPLQTAGRTYVYAPLSSYNAGFNTTLSSNAGDITWTFNMRSPRLGNTNSGFTAGLWGYAAVLAATGSDFLTANGYAVIETKGTTTNALSLVKFTSGFTPTTIIGPSADNLAITDFFSVKVVYTPSTNTWKLYVRNDGATKADPTTTSTQVGAATVDNTYTSSIMSHFGFFANHGTANATGAGSGVLSIDDYKVTELLPAPELDATTTVSAITGTTATSGGNILSDGGISITARGVCWSTTTTPTVLLSTKTVDAGTIGIFSSNLIGLTGSTTYYVRSYVSNVTGTFYGSEVSFTTLPTPVSITTGATITENFDGIGTATIAQVPSGWKVERNITVKNMAFSTAVNNTENNAGNDMTTTANAIYNFGAGVAVTASDRAIGGLLGAGAKSANVYLQLKNTGVTAFTSLNISYNVEKYKTGNQANGFSMQLYYSTDGVTFTSAGTDFLTLFGDDGSNTGFSSAPGVTVSVTNKVLSKVIAAGNTLYLAWNFSPTTGLQSGLSPALAIDDVNITAIGITMPIIGTTTLGTYGGTNANVNGDVTDEGSSTISARGVCWSTSPIPTVELLTKTIEAGTIGTFTSNIPGLISGTKYYARSYATNASGTSYGTEINFTTKSIPNLDVTSAISNLASSTATSGGNVLSSGGYNVSAKGVCWSTSLSPTVDLTTKTNDGTSTGVFTSNLIDLVPNTTYYVRSYATNALGTGYGTEISFTTVVTGLNSTHTSGGIIVVGKQIICPESGKLEIFDMKGVKLMQAQNTKELNTELRAGLYLVRFTNNELQQITRKVAIQ